MALGGFRDRHIEDRRSVQLDALVSKLLSLLHRTDRAAGILEPVAGDAFLAAMAHASRDAFRQPILQEGRIQYALPFLGWYRVVLLGERTVRDCYLARTACGGLSGVTSHGMLAPDTPVWVLLGRPGAPGVILWADNPPVADPRLELPDWLVPGSRVGYRWLGHYAQLLVLDGQQPISALSNRSHGAPLDQLPGDWSLLAPTGVGIHLDAFLAFLRASDFCGIWLHYLDETLRLAGHQLQIWSAAHQEYYGEEQGLTKAYRGLSFYGWELLGASGPEALAGLLRDASLTEELQGMLPRIPAGKLQPFHRWMEWAGGAQYGLRRELVMPPAGDRQGSWIFQDGKLEGVSGSSLPQAVFREGVLEDGLYYASSRKGIIFAKRSRLPVASPRSSPAKLQPASVPELPQADEEALLFESMNLLDFVLYHTEGKALAGARASEDFHYEAPPLLPALVRTDGRFGYRREPAAGTPEGYTDSESAFGLLPSGDFFLQGPFGESIRSLGGDLILSAPRRIVLQSGEDTIVLGGQDLVLRARRDADFTAGQGTMRVKAEHDLQLLGGNSGEGGVLIESRSRIADPYFPEMGGAGTRTPGIVLKCEQGTVRLLCDSWAVDTSNVLMRSDTVLVMADSSVWFIRTAAAEVYGDPSRPGRIDQHGVSASRLDSSVIVRRDMAVGGGALFGGQVSTVSGHFASPQGGQVGRILDLPRLRSNLHNSVEASRQEALAAAAQWLVQLEQGLWPEELAKQVSFSLRIEQDYGLSDEFLLPAAAWQEMMEAGVLPAGAVWSEPAVRYQGQQQLPWPGYRLWVQSASLWYAGWDPFALADGSVQSYDQLQHKEARWDKRLPSSHYYVYAR